MNKKYPYPLTVVADRYTGSYSDGKFTAWNKEFYEIPTAITDGDMECFDFWDKDSPTRHLYKVGKGDTPEEAIDSLITNLN